MLDRIRAAVASLAATLTLLPCLACGVFAAEPVQVSGPTGGGTRGYAFASPAVDVADYGYVVQEFFLDGRAAGFALAPGTEQSSDGRWTLRRNAESVPYRTRILVVRPAEQANFNGTVIVHWQNVTAGYELGSVAPGEYLRGHAWVGVSAQKVGIDGFEGPDAAGLRQWDPARYGSLHHPGDDYSYDIFTQAGHAVGPERPRLENDPMGGLAVERLVAAGASQSAARLRTYINGVHPLEGVFDGYIPYIDFGSTLPFGAGEAGGGIGRGNTLIRTDLDAKVFVVNSETEVTSHVGSRQPDTQDYRFWEVAGTSHVNVERSLIGVEGAEVRPGFPLTDLQTPNWLPFRPAYDAAVRHMHLWLTEGVAPPAAPLIEVTGDRQIVRDARGNALGGIRLPDFAAPTAEHRGTGVNKPGGYRLGFLFGFSRQFTDAELAALYGGSADYMRQWDAALAAAVGAGYVLAEDGPDMRAAALAWSRRLD